MERLFCHLEYRSCNTSMSFQHLVCANFLDLHSANDQHVLNVYCVLEVLDPVAIHNSVSTSVFHNRVSYASIKGDHRNVAELTP